MSILNITEMIYIVSIAFQLVAGLLLLIGNTKTSKKSIVSKFCTQHRVISVYPDGSLKDYEELVEVAQIVWGNKFAFIYLILGYLLSIFSVAPEKKWMTFGKVLFLSTLLIYISIKFIEYKSKKYGKVNFNEFILDKGAMAVEVPFPEKM
mgnify:CR=1 FL=1